MIVVITQLLGGVGMFLFAMHFLENALQELSGRKFKIFLQKMAARPLSAIAGSALITALLQSSSMVSLMILAFWVPVYLLSNNPWHWCWVLTWEPP